MAGHPSTPNSAMATVCWFGLCYRYLVFQTGLGHNVAWAKF